MGQYPTISIDQPMLFRLLSWQAMHLEHQMRLDIDDRYRFDQFESGHETRDVLENGIRRAHMEARLGRTATR